MKYNQPFGIAEVDAPYINGNPSTGTAGSIPPAESIEYPQREIANIVADAGYTPSNSDLHQLAKAVQSGSLVYAVDAGTVNAVAITVTPTPVLKAGMCFLVKISNTNTGASVINVNAIGAKNVVHMDGSAIERFELLTGALALFAFDGTSFQLAWRQRQPGMPIYLQASTDYYVATTGSDSNSGLTAGTPFLTWQKVASVMSAFNLNGFNITVHIADGTYTGGLLLPNMAGAGNVNWVGNSGSPANVVMSTTNKSAVIGTYCGTAHTFNGLMVGALGALGGDSISGFNILGPGTSIVLYNIEYAACVGAHISVQTLANVFLGGTQRIMAGCTGNALVGGHHIHTAVGGMVTTSGVTPPSLTIGAVSTLAGAFIYASTLGQTSVSYTSITAPGNLVGTKYLVSANAVINAFGLGTSYYPGTIAGSAATGGQYV